MTTGPAGVRGLNTEMGRIPVEATDEERMRALIATISSYIEYYHGGVVEMVSFEGDRVQVRLDGACRGCDLAPVTLRGWVEGTVKQFFPHVTVVEAIDDGNG